MLSKCANPACCNLFRYLHEGKLYLINSEPALAGRKRLSGRSTPRSPEYAWLCSACSSRMTIDMDEEKGTVAVIATEILECGTCIRIRNETRGPMEQ